MAETIRAADDVTKPFSPAELIPRVDAALLNAAHVVANAG